MINPYQEFAFPATTAKYVKLRLLTNQNGYDNPFEIREFQLMGHLIETSKTSSK